MDLASRFIETIQNWAYVARVAMFVKLPYSVCDIVGRLQESGLLHRGEVRDVRHIVEGAPPRTTLMEPSHPHFSSRCKSAFGEDDQAPLRVSALVVFPLQEKVKPSAKLLGGSLDRLVAPQRVALFYGGRVEVTSGFGRSPDGSRYIRQDCLASSCIGLSPEVASAANLRGMEWDGLMIWEVAGLDLVQSLERK